MKAELRASFFDDEDEVLLECFRFDAKADCLDTTVAGGGGGGIFVFSFTGFKDFNDVSACS